MICFVEGILEEVQPLSITLNVGGVGYLINVPLSTSSQVSNLGSNVRLHTQFVVREDSQQLYGFASLKEKSAFIALTEKVSGIGPKIALNILSRLSVESLASAIKSGNVSLLTKCPGIGKKTAERLVLELKDVFEKLPVFEKQDSTNATLTPIDGRQGTGLLDDAVAALVTLGFKQNDAVKRVEKLLASNAGEDWSLEALIKSALAG